MALISLDNRIKLEIMALKGDSLGPLEFIFQTDETTGEIEDLTGAIFEGEILRGKEIVHRFTTDELSFNDITSSLTLSLSSSVTSKFGNMVVKFQIRQILNDTTTTRIVGTITFLQDV